MATTAGVKMSPCRLLEENGRAHFMTKRFDREIVGDNTQKHHLQTFCAMNHLDFRQRGTHDYERLFMTISKLGLDDEAKNQTFRRMAFNVMARNCDDHTKNFGFVLKNKQSSELAPAYDVTHAYNPKGEWAYQHLMSVNGTFKDVTRADLIEVADRSGVRRTEDALADVHAAITNWSEYAREAAIPKTLRDRVAGDLLAI
jgi:serine/threonine-protein kinase HipA